MDKRIESVQVMRALAATLVLYSHAIDQVPSHLAGTVWQLKVPNWGDFGAVGVDVFFVISGFVITLLCTRKPTQPHKFLLRRFARIYPPYLLVTAVIVANALHKHVALDMYKLARSVLLLPEWRSATDTPLLAIGWTLTFEIWFYLLAALALLFGGRGFIVRILLFPSALVAIGTVFHFTNPLLVFATNPIQMEFVLGVCIGALYRRDWLPSRTTCLGLLVLGCLWFGAGIIHGYNDVSEAPWTLAAVRSWDRVFYWGVGALLVFAGAVFTEKSLRLKTPAAVVFCGDASYAIYLASPIAVPLMAKQWHRIGDPFPDLFILVATVCAVGVGAAFYYLFDRPVQNGFKHLRKQASG